MASPRAEIATAISEAIDRAASAGQLSLPPGVELPAIGVERPARPEHGDYASNAAMQLAPVARRAPMAIAETLRDHMGNLACVLETSVAAPGFLNFRLDPAWVAAQ